MKIDVRYFASVREALGAGETLELAEGGTVADARQHLIASDAQHADALARGRALRCARNRVLCDESAALGEGDELAFFPPVTGG